MNRFKNDSHADFLKNTVWGLNRTGRFDWFSVLNGFRGYQKHPNDSDIISEVIVDQSFQRRSYSGLHCIEHHFIRTIPQQNNAYHGAVFDVESFQLIWE